MIVGFHASEPDPPILIAAAVIEHLDEWWGKSAISHESLTSPDVGVRYTQPPPMEVHADASTRTVIHSGALPEFDSARASNRRGNVRESIERWLTAVRSLQRWIHRPNRQQLMSADHESIA